MAATGALGDDRLVAVPVLGAARTVALENALCGTRVLVTLGLSTTTTVRVVAGVHGDTTDLWPLAEPAVTARLANLALLVLLAGRVRLRTPW